MATVLLSAAGAAVGSSIGGTVAGLSTAVIGRAVGATIGRVIDQRLLGTGSQSVETGKVDRFRLSGSGEGETVSQVYGAMRVGGQVIWSSDFLETTTVETTGGGKGAPSQPKTTTTTYTYSINLALALCEGLITGVRRVWADGEEIPITSLNIRVYKGDAAQLPDPLLEAIEGAGQVPAYRGTAYVVLEGLQLEQFGNRVPQFSFEVARPDQPEVPDSLDLARAVQGVALMPGTGEYALATQPVYYTSGPDTRWAANLNSPGNKPDALVSYDALTAELPNARSASLIVSWFGNDLRAGNCTIHPRVEQTSFDGETMPWTVSGLSRAAAGTVPYSNGQPVYGGTPADTSVIQTIQTLRTQGKHVMFYPFILMDQLTGAGLPDPYGGAEQAHLPWRGRITTSLAPTMPGSPDGTATADAEVAAFWGTARPEHFQISGGTVTYVGPNEWSFSRFILHYAALCAAAGGVDSFCIGSELRGLTQIRGAGNAFPFVARLIQLAADVRSLLGAGTKISYAADWSEYFGYQPQDGSGDRYFHLDPLWASPNIDFIGIDNYVPLSDWRAGEDHADVAAGSIYDLDYLRGNIEGGEGYDWFYASDADAFAQTRTPITDGAHNEPWIYRYKDFRNWWLNPHHERIGGVRQSAATAWVPQSKPIWFTEYGCAAIDKGTNQPNKFLDPKSSESSLPKFSSGARDDFIQMQYIRAMNSFYADAANNPVSAVYGAPMIDMSKGFLWAWDARPYPWFPGNTELWSDGGNYPRGHWINGRTAARPLASVVEEICARAGLTEIDTSKLYGYVRGYEVAEVNSARAALQPLMLRYGFDAVERAGSVHFIMRDGQVPIDVEPDLFARVEELDGVTEAERDPELEISGRVRLQFVESDGSYDIVAEESVLPDEATHGVSTSEFALSMTRGEGRQTVERWLAEARVSRDKLKLALPPSQLSIAAGDVIRVPGGAGAEPTRFRVDRVDQGTYQLLEAVRIDPGVYTPADVADEPPIFRPFVRPTPVTPIFLDLPLLRGDEVEHAPFVAATASNWPGSAAVYRSPAPSNYTFNTLLPARAVSGLSLTDLPAAPHGVTDRTGALMVQLTSGTLESVEDAALLAGANLAAIGDGSPDGWELIQFQNAELVGTQTYVLGNLLRGQQGTDALMPPLWPAGSRFVLLNGAVSQIDMAANYRNVTQYFRIGPAQLDVADPSYVDRVYAFAGNGLRPYAPAHLRAEPDDLGDLQIYWTRRTRIDGDFWDGEVPLGETSEAYLLRVWSGGTLLREESPKLPNWTYTLADQVSDGATGAVTLDVAQLSSRYGAGLSARLDITL